MRTRNLGRDADGYQVVNGTEAETLSSSEERALLTELSRCREKLNMALAKIRSVSRRRFRAQNPGSVHHGAQRRTTQNAGQAWRCIQAT